MEEKIWDFIERYKTLFFLIILTVLSLYIRFSMLNVQSGDYTEFLQPWFNTLKENGGLKALKIEIGNYNAPYLTIMALLTYLPIDSLTSIKLVSILFDYVCAIMVVLIARLFIEDNSKKEFFSVILYGTILFLPTVLLNSAWWGQCDAIYTAFILISLYYLLKEKYFLAFVFLGISFAFKLQFLFIFPVYVLIYISKRKFPIYYFAIIPIMDIILCIPSMLFGRSLKSCFEVYFNQTSYYEQYLSLNFPGIYNLLFANNDYLVFAPNLGVSRIGTLVTLAVFILIAYVVLYKKVDFDKKSIIEFGLWSIMIATFLLPQMHDRYLFAGDILSILYFFINKDKIYVPVGISFLSAFCYGKFLFNEIGAIPLQYLSVGYLVLLILVSKDIVKKYLTVETNLKEEL